MYFYFISISACIVAFTIYKLSRKPKEYDNSDVVPFEKYYLNSIPVKINLNEMISNVSKVFNDINSLTISNTNDTTSIPVDVSDELLLMD